MAITKYKLAQRLVWVFLERLLENLNELLGPPNTMIPPLKDKEELRPPGSQWKGRNGRASAVADKPRCIFYLGDIIV